MDFITNVVIGDGTPFTLNHWNGSVEIDGHPVATAIGKSNSGSVSGWLTQAGANLHARTLQASRMPGQDIFVLDHQVFPEDDWGHPSSRYFVTVARCDAFGIES